MRISELTRIDACVWMSPAREPCAFPAVVRGQAPSGGHGGHGPGPGQERGIPARHRPRPAWPCPTPIPLRIPHRGVAAFDPDEGVVSGRGVAFDIACGVRTLVSNLEATDVAPHAEHLPMRFFSRIPAGVGSTGGLRLKPRNWTPCSKAARCGRYPGATGRRPTWNTWRTRPHGRGPARDGLRAATKNARKTRSAPWGRQPLPGSSSRG